MIWTTYKKGQLNQELNQKNKIMSKIYIENSKFMEFIDELATRITEERF